MSAFANPLVPWSVEVKTRDAHDAGIASSVFIKIYGEKGATQPIELEPFSDPDRPNVSNFSQAKKSYFELEREDVGMVTSIEVWHDAPIGWGMEFLRLQQGNNEWKFTLKGDRDTIKSQRELDPQLTGVPKPTKMIGEYSAVSSGSNRFHSAAKRDDYRAVEKMLQSQEYTVDVQDKVGRTATMYACSYGGLEALKVLLEYAADLSRTDKLGRTALHYACMNERANLEIVNKLLSEQYVPAGGAGGYDDDDSRSGAANANEIAKRRGKFIRCRDQFGRTAMHYAASFGFFKVVQQLEGFCHIAITDKDGLGLTPLHCAALQGEAETARRLIELGAGSNVGAKDHEEKTFLHHAATAGHTAFIDYLFTYKLFNANTKKNLEALLETGDKLDRTPLLSAAGAGHLDTVRKLVDLKADFYHEDKDKSNMMHMAARKGNDALLTFASSKWDVNSANEFKYTALHVAAEANNEAAIQWLVKHGADLEARSLDGSTAFDIAAELNHLNIKRALENAAEYLKAVKAASASAAGGLDGGASAALDDMPVDKMSATPLASGGSNRSKKEPANTAAPKDALGPDVMQLVRQNRELQSELHQTRLQLDEKRKGDSFTKAPPTTSDNRQCDQGSCIIS